MTARGVYNLKIEQVCTHQLIGSLEVHDVLLVDTLGEELVVDFELVGPLRGPHFVLDRLEGQCWSRGMGGLGFSPHLLWLLLLLRQGCSGSRRGAGNSVVVVEVASSLVLFSFLSITATVH